MYLRCQPLPENTKVIAITHSVNMETSNKTLTPQLQLQHVWLAILDDSLYQTQ